MKKLLLALALALAGVSGLSASDAMAPKLEKMVAFLDESNRASALNVVSEIVKEDWEELEPEDIESYLSAANDFASSDIDDDHMVTAIFTLVDAIVKKERSYLNNTIVRDILEKLGEVRSISPYSDEEVVAELVVNARVNRILSAIDEFKHAESVVSKGSALDSVADDIEALYSDHLVWEKLQLAWNDLELPAMPLYFNAKRVELYTKLKHILGR